MSSEDKLAILKEVRHKSYIMERSKQELKSYLTNVTAEDNCLTDYKAELVQLEQEKVARLEELRQLENDMACIEVLVDQTNQAKGGAYSGACESYGHFCSVKKQVDILRSECLGLEMSQALDMDLQEMVDRLGVTEEQGENGTNRPSLSRKCPQCDKDIHKNSPVCTFCKEKIRGNKS
eukprot:GFUD01035895.1.p1 GENE.GFUD01035895.1~~GFUD01035895.1.p1  ORF type:complete len:178 (+),score=56.44 GFUD01035895.1:110-643(+)